MTFLLRVLACKDGTWACHWSRRELDCERGEALDHVTALAGEHRPSEIVVHYRDGRLHTLATFDDTPATPGTEPPEPG